MNLPPVSYVLGVCHPPAISWRNRHQVSATFLHGLGGEICTGNIFSNPKRQAAGIWSRCLLILVRMRQEEQHNRDRLQIHAAFSSSSIIPNPVKKTPQRRTHQGIPRIYC